MGEWKTPSEAAQETGLDRRKVIELCMEHGIEIYQGRLDLERLRPVVATEIAQGTSGSEVAPQPQASPPQVPMNDTHVPRERAAGGFIGDKGARGEDSVPTLLAHGEVWLSKERAAELGLHYPEPEKIPTTTLQRLRQDACQGFPDVRQVAPGEVMLTPEGENLAVRFWGWWREEGTLAAEARSWDQLEPALRDKVRMIVVAIKRELPTP